MAGSVNTIRRLVDKLARRIRAQRAIENAVTGGTATLLLVMLFLVLFKTTWMTFDQMLIGCLGALTIPVALAIWAWTRPLDKIALAQKLDRAHNLHDRLSTALALEEKGEQSAWAQAQIDDAIEHLDVVEVGPASPFKRPTDLVPLALVVAVVGGLMFLPDFDHRGELPPPIAIEHDAVLDEATIALERDRLEALKRQLEGVEDPEARELVEEIDQLLDAVENRELSERQFLDELDRIEKEFFEKEESTSDQVAEALKEAAEELEKEAGKDLEDSPEMKELVDALKEKDMDGASEALGKLAESMTKDMSEKDMERVAELLEKFADKIDPTNPALQELYEKNKEAFDKLAEKFGDRDDMTESEKQRLDRAKEKMEQAKERQSEAEKKEASRRLKQLKRKYESLSKEAEKVVKGDKGEREANSEDESTDDADYANDAGRKAKELQKEAEKDGQSQKSDNAKKQAREQIEQMREALKRGSKGGDSQADKQRAEQMKEFLERARGNPTPAKGESSKKPQNGEQGEQAKAGDPGEMPTQEGKKGNSPGAKDGQFKGENNKGTNEEAENETNYAGKGKGSRELGEETDLDGKRRDEKVDGQLAEGASKSEIIKDASERGFATTQYKDVYVDYEEVVEEVMEKEKVPSGYRYYVKRYFQLIKPQE